MKTADEIYQEMCSNYAELTGVTVRDGCDMAVRLYAAAAQIESLYLYNDWVKAQCFPQTASGEHLDLHAEMRGLKRMEASYSSGLIKFSAAAPAEQVLTVPVGTVCVTASGVRFVTTHDGEIPVGETYCECLAMCTDSGVSGNVEANTVVFMQQPPIGIVNCVNEDAFTGGIAEESDENLKKRILATYNSLPTGANSAYYEKIALSVAGVAAVKVIPKKRGVGTVDIIISSDTGMPTESIVSEVLFQMNLAREICVDIEVKAPIAVTVDIEIGIDVENGYSFNTVSDNVKQAISNYFNGTLLGLDVLRAKLGNIVYGVEGVRNYSITRPGADVSGMEDELPVLGAITVNQLS